MIDGFLQWFFRQLSPLGTERQHLEKLWITVLDRVRANDLADDEWLKSDKPKQFSHSLNSRRLATMRRAARVSNTGFPAELWFHPKMHR